MRAGKNFWHGLGTVLDIWPSGPAQSRLRFNLPTNEEAFREDWFKTGHDVQEAFRLFREQNGVRKSQDITRR